MLATGQDEYQAEIERITARIHHLRGLKEAQEPGSEYERRFQQQITELTAVLMSWEDSVTDLRETDEEIDTAHETLDLVLRHSDRTADGWLRAARRLAILGVPLVFLSLVWVPSWIQPTAGGAMVAGAVGCLLVGVHARRRAAVEVEEARQAVRDAESRHAALLPTTTTVDRGRVPLLARD